MSLIQFPVENLINTTEDVQISLMSRSSRYRNSSRGGEQQSTTDLQVGKWECPICGETRQFYKRPGKSHKTPIGGLRNHIRSTLDEQHGGDSVPEVYADSETLEDSVSVDGTL